MTQFLHGRLAESEDDADSVCITDFCGRHRPSGLPTSFWADWDRKTGLVTFGGEWSDVPPMKSAKEPTKATVYRHAWKHGSDLGKPIGEGKKPKPPALGTVWTARARICFIDDSTDPPKWATVMAVGDTPAEIAKALKAARAKHPGKTLWVQSDTGGRYIPEGMEEQRMSRFLRGRLGESHEGSERPSHSGSAWIKFRRAMIDRVAAEQGLTTKRAAEWFDRQVVTGEFDEDFLDWQARQAGTPGKGVMGEADDDKNELVDRKLVSASIRRSAESYRNENSRHSNQQMISDDRSAMLDVSEQVAAGKWADAYEDASRLNTNPREAIDRAAWKMLETRGKGGMGESHEDEPEGPDTQEAYVLQDVRRGNGIDVFRAGKHWRTFREPEDRPAKFGAHESLAPRDAALKAIRADMEKEQFWPDVYYVNERGNTDLLDVKTGKIVKSWV